MKKQYWLILFAVILIADLVAVQFNYTTAEHIFKPLIVIWLLAYFVLQLRAIASPLKKWIIGGLFFSWLGDMLLLLQNDNPTFFLWGLSAFLIAHIFYIFFFHFIRLRENIRSRWGLMLIVVVYYIILISILSPHLGDMKSPVRIYAVVISFMFLLALHTLFIKNKRAGLWMMTGAMLFVISDSVLAVNKFYQPFEMAGVVVMLTYGLAQLFIAEGAIRYISSTDKE
jgi:uncharacterized membrane protein YhhN